MPKLALFGGPKIRSQPFSAYKTIGEEERIAVDRVMRTGVLSQFLGKWHDDFYGGPEVQAFEKEWAEKFQAKHCISMNSNSSGLHAALGACGVGYGDEVIVTPYSICVSATAPLVWNATPVFADIDENNFCLSAESIRKKITPRTKGIVVVHLFGCPADMDEIMQVAREHKLFVIEDCAQCPGATYKGRQVGTIGDIGVFSLNYHKHIHTGEGGMCTTQSAELAERMALIRNHAEAVVGPKGVGRLDNMIGFNFRMSELHAAIGRQQLKKLDAELKRRIEIGHRFARTVSELPFASTTELHDRVHAFYVQAFRYDAKVAGVPREQFVKAVKAELAPILGLEILGVPIGNGYEKPLYLLPLFQERMAYKNGFPFKGDENYAKGLCPVTERMHFEELWTHAFVKSSLSDSDVKDVIDAYCKVAENLDELRNAKE